jgi:hypothetical protein
VAAAPDAPVQKPVHRGLVSDMGTFMQSVGAAWLMVSLGASATFDLR